MLSLFYLLLLLIFVQIVKVMRECYFNTGEVTFLMIQNTKCEQNLSCVVYEIQPPWSSGHDVLITKPY